MSLSIAYDVSETEENIFSPYPTTEQFELMDSSWFTEKVNESGTTAEVGMFGAADAQGTDRYYFWMKF